MFTQPLTYKPSTTHTWFGYYLFLQLLCVGILSPSISSAQSTTRAFQVQQFRPWFDPRGMFQTQSGETLGQFSYHAGFLVNYGHHPMVAQGGGGRSVPIISHQIGADFAAGFGILPWLDVHLVLPMTLYQTGHIPDHPAFADADRDQSVTGFALSDLKLGVKLQALQEHKHFVSLAFMLYAGAPTGDTQRFNGEDGFRLGGFLALSKRFQSFKLALNVGYRYLPPTTFVDLDLQHELFYSLGGRLRVAPNTLDLIFELTGSGILSTEMTWNKIPIDAYIGAKIYPLSNLDLAVQLGVAVGIIAGYGTPTLRALGGVTWAPRKYDRDKDGLTDNIDRCPSVEGPKENRGCPWPDSDGDGLKDNVDRCPKQIGPTFNKGCPLTDIDKDGVTDNIDRCPKQKGPKENDGCPWGDKDKDGLTDNIDKCPEKSGPKENKGCPWGDQDKDGLTDNIDKCPKQKGPKENNGCPDTDRDKDGIIDRLDACPDVPGVKVATKKTKIGCPKKVLIEVTKEEIKILQKIEFKTGSATINKRSYGIIEQVISVLKSRPKMRLRIEGHTDDVGDKTFNMNLSKKRAEAVFQFIVTRGKIDAKRLTHEGYGMNKPLVPNTSTENRAKNRRVQFNVIKQPTSTPAQNTK
ncbi:MAG: hypothetical protein CL920_22000 [Deltaproteobacteria bacterium]|nr:hypothetical protein [Deltaproteobacteria bacterium]MBU51371.1 hypothetical protein [Deltaproteobacteria bacterium]